jgi:MYXO-CTERM domain-containing protein
MRFYRNIQLLFISVAFVATMVLLSPIAHAQSTTEVTAEVDKTELAVGEILNLAVTIVGPPNPREPDLPDVDGLELTAPPSTFRETSIRNGTIRSRVSYHYRLVATKEGKVTVGPLNVTISGQAYETDPIQVTILRGLGEATTAPDQTQAQQSEPDPDSAGPTGSERIFVEAFVDDENPYLGQQITYTFRFYRRSAFPAFGRFGQPRYQAPDFGGFWNNQETKQNQLDETIGFNRYTVVELQTVLFPSVVGPTTIEQAMLTIPGDGFDSPTRLAADPIIMNVRPLPPSAPGQFTGAVGKFELDAKVNDTTGKVNEPLTLTVTVLGEGNIETLPDPAWPDFEDWRVFESQARTASRVVDGKLTGNRTYESILVPEKAGALVIPEIGYSYFNPETGEYMAAITDPIAMSIAEADGSFPLPPLLSDGRGTVERTGSDIRHIKPVPSALGRPGTALTSNVTYWAAWGLPLFALAGAVAWQRRRTLIEGDNPAIRRRNARLDAQATLTKARQSGENPQAIVGQVLISYISALLRSPVVGLTNEALASKLLAVGVNSDLVQQVEDALRAGDMAKYAPVKSDSSTDYAYLTQAEQLVSDLDEAFVL